MISLSTPMPLLSPVITKHFHQNVTSSLKMEIILRDCVAIPALTQPCLKFNKLSNTDIFLRSFCIVFS